MKTFRVFIILGLISCTNPHTHSTPLSAFEEVTPAYIKEQKELYSHAITEQEKLQIWLEWCLSLFAKHTLAELCMAEINNLENIHSTMNGFESNTLLDAHINYLQWVIEKADQETDKIIYELMEWVCIFELDRNQLWQNCGNQHPSPYAYSAYATMED